MPRILITSLEKKLFIPSLFFLLMGVHGCKKENIAPDFQKYVEMFLAEGAKRGRKLHANNVIIKFNPAPNEASQCQPGNIILINEGAWKRSNELIKEATIFHEMGHCILGLNHNNCFLPDATSESIMVGGGGTCITDYLFAPYGGMRRAYYLDQLFSISPVPAPQWSKLDEFKDETLGKKRMLANSEEFNDISNINIALAKTNSISNGKLTIDGTSYISFKNISKEELNQENIEIESSFKNMGNNGDSFTLRWTPMLKNTVIHNNYEIGIWYKNGEALLFLNINELVGYAKKLLAKFKKMNTTS